MADENWRKLKVWTDTTADAVNKLGAALSEVIASLDDLQRRIEALERRTPPGT